MPDIEHSIGGKDFERRVSQRLRRKWKKGEARRNARREVKQKAPGLERVKDGQGLSTPLVPTDRYGCAACA
jgi:hypothetical protein